VASPRKPAQEQGQAQVTDTLRRMREKCLGRTWEKKKKQGNQGWPYQRRLKKKAAPKCPSQKKRRVQHEAIWSESRDSEKRKKNQRRAGKTEPRYLNKKRMKQRMLGVVRKIDFDQKETLTGRSRIRFMKKLTKSEGNT